MCEKFLSNWAFLLTVIAIKLTVKHESASKAGLCELKRLKYSNEEVKRYGKYIRSNAPSQGR